MHCMKPKLCLGRNFKRFNSQFIQPTYICINWMKQMSQNGTLWLHPSPRNVSEMGPNSSSSRPYSLSGNGRIKFEDFRKSRSGPQSWSQIWALHLKRQRKRKCNKKKTVKRKRRTRESNSYSQKLLNNRVLDSRASQGLWLEPVGPFIFV